MSELTERQEQEMIEKARAGDPEANYQMSLWALEQAIAEPDEERWNRLAAKCLVKAAEAGYEPAKEKMNELLAQSADGQDEAPGQHEAAVVQSAKTTDEPAAGPVRTEPEGSQPRSRDFAGTAAKLGTSAAAAFAGLGGKVKGLFAKSEKKEGGVTGTDAAEGKKGGWFDFSQWDNAKWKKMQIICAVICVLLALLIAIMLISGKKRDSKKDGEIVIPAADVVVTPVPSTPTPAPKEYPSADIKAEIAAAALAVYPEETDYVTEPTTRTVATSSSPLNMRNGPSSNNDLVSSVAKDTVIDVYAFKNGWALTKVGTTWGWCSVEYLK